MTLAAVRVGLRIRPPNPEEEEGGSRQCIAQIPDTTQVVLGADRAFTFDYVFSPQVSQCEIYAACIQPLVDKFLAGYNATVLAYGQTGSGKTYTMGTSLSAGGDGMLNVYDTDTDSQAGIVPRAIGRVYQYIDEQRTKAPGSLFQVSLSFLELYNEELVDLLAQKSAAAPSCLADSSTVVEPTIREDGQGRILWVGIVQKSVSSYHETLGYLRQGMLSRTTAATSMNMSSSRSHAIFTLTLRQIRPLVTGVPSGKGAGEPTGTCPATTTLVSKIHFVDLAGSERIKRTQAVGNRVKEGISINAGLLALGNVISALGDPLRKATHVPYRNSKLTRLLQDSLGGNSQTLMLACVSPSELNFAETLNTLRYANRARNIRNKVAINIDTKEGSGREHAVEIGKLKAEIARLRLELSKTISSNSVADGPATVDDAAAAELSPVVPRTPAAAECKGGQASQADLRLAHKRSLGSIPAACRKAGNGILSTQPAITRRASQPLLSTNKSALTIAQLRKQVQQLDTERRKATQKVSEVCARYQAQLQHQEDEIARLRLQLANHAGISSNDSPAIPQGPSPGAPSQARGALDAPDELHSGPDDEIQVKFLKKLIECEISTCFHARKLVKCRDEYLRKQDILMNEQSDLLLELYDIDEHLASQDGGAGVDSHRTHILDRIKLIDAELHYLDLKIRDTESELTLVNATGASHHRHLSSSRARAGAKPTGGSPSDQLNLVMKNIDEITKISRAAFASLLQNTPGSDLEAALYAFVQDAIDAQMALWEDSKAVARLKEENHELNRTLVALRKAMIHSVIGYERHLVRLEGQLKHLMGGTLGLSSSSDASLTSFITIANSSPVFGECGDSGYHSLSLSSVNDKAGRADLGLAVSGTPSTPSTVSARTAAALDMTMASLPKNDSGSDDQPNIAQKIYQRGILGLAVRSVNGHISAARDLHSLLIKEAQMEDHCCASVVRDRAAEGPTVGEDDCQHVKCSDGEVSDSISRDSSTHSLTSTFAKDLLGQSRAETPSPSAATTTATTGTIASRRSKSMTSKPSVSSLNAPPRNVRRDAESMLVSTTSSPSTPATLGTPLSASAKRGRGLGISKSFQYSDLPPLSRCTSFTARLQQIRSQTSTPGIFSPTDMPKRDNNGSSSSNASSSNSPETGSFKTMPEEAHGDGQWTDSHFYQQQPNGPSPSNGGGGGNNSSEGSANNSADAEECTGKSAAEDEKWADCLGPRIGLACSEEATRRQGIPIQSETSGVDEESSDARGIGASLQISGPAQVTAGDNSQDQTNVSPTLLANKVMRTSFPSSLLTQSSSEGPVDTVPDSADDSRSMSESPIPNSTTAADNIIHLRQPPSLDSLKPRPSQELSLITSTSQILMARRSNGGDSAQNLLRPVFYDPHLDERLQVPTSATASTGNICRRNPRNPHLIRSGSMVVIGSHVAESPLSPSPARRARLMSNPTTLGSYNTASQVLYPGVQDDETNVSVGASNGGDESVTLAGSTPKSHALAQDLEQTKQDDDGNDGGSSGGGGGGDDDAIDEDYGQEHDGDRASLISEISSMGCIVYCDSGAAKYGSTSNLVLTVDHKSQPSMLHQNSLPSSTTSTHPGPPMMPQLPAAATRLSLRESHTTGTRPLQTVSESKPASLETISNVNGSAQSVGGSFGTKLTARVRRNTLANLVRKASMSFYKPSSYYQHSHSSTTTTLQGIPETEIEVQQRQASLRKSESAGRADCKTPPHCTVSQQSEGKALGRRRSVARTVSKVFRSIGLSSPSSPPSQSSSFSRRRGASAQSSKSDRRLDMPRQRTSTIASIPPSSRALSGFTGKPTSSNEKSLSLDPGGSGSVSGSGNIIGSSSSTTAAAVAMRGPAARTAEARYKKRPPSLRHVAPNRRSISDPSHITFDFKSPYEPSVIPTVTFANQRVNYQQQRQQRSPTSPTQRRQRVLNKRSRSEVNLLSRFISESTAPAQAGPRATATAAAAATAVAVDQNDNGSYQHYFLRNHSTNKLIRKLWVSSPKRDKPELDADINRVPYSAFTSKFARATAANQPVTPMSARSTTTTAGALVSPASLTSPELSPHADSPVDPNLSRDMMMISPRSEFGGPGITNNSMAGRLMAPSPPARKLTHKLSRRVMAGSRSPVRAALEETK